MNAVAGIRRTMKQLVDGTIRVSVDIEPKDAEHFMKILGQIDMPVALAPLNLNAAPQVEDTDPPYAGPVTFSKADLESKDIGSSTWTSLGPLCKSAIMLGKEERFQEWVSDLGRQPNGPGDSPSEFTAGEKECADFIRRHCGVESRKELDESTEAKDDFKDMMRKYRGWLESQH